MITGYCPSVSCCAKSVSCRPDRYHDNWGFSVTTIIPNEMYEGLGISLAACMSTVHEWGSTMAYPRPRDTVLCQGSLSRRGNLGSHKIPCVRRTLAGLVMIDAPGFIHTPIKFYWPKEKETSQAKWPHPKYEWDLHMPWTKWDNTGIVSNVAAPELTRYDGMVNDMH